ncbi:FliM/FliN family flagellar motor switch protein [Pendulispora rubella]|uniref:FliM/FliN family flagellar motor switch protein n=1 Tax=Pendulispora rubella TaxID=2741070 RepID=A0ABZ2L0Y4_9BACT
MSRTVRRYPWDALDGMSARSLEAMRALRHLLTASGSIATMERALAEILDSRIEVRLRHVRDASRAGRSDPSAVTFALEDDTGTPRVWLEVEGALAAQVAARALRRPLLRTSSLDPFSPPPATVFGAFAAVLVTTLRRGAGALPLRVRTMDAAMEDALFASFTVVLGDEAFLARVAFSPADPLLSPRTEPPWDRAGLVRLGDIPLSMPIVASVAMSTVAEMKTLTPGAVWLPPPWSLSGPVTLCAPRSDRGVSATLGADGKLVVGGSVEDLSMAREDNALVENAGDIAVVVRVEVGSAEMRAREWANVRPGDVITLGRPVGSSVLLRVGGQEVARGELVDIEGELGVRILENQG